MRLPGIGSLYAQGSTMYSDGLVHPCTCSCRASHPDYDPPPIDAPVLDFRITRQMPPFDSLGGGTVALSTAKTE